MVTHLASARRAADRPAGFSAFAVLPLPSPLPFDLVDRLNDSTAAAPARARKETLLPPPTSRRNEPTHEDGMAPPLPPFRSRPPSCSSSSSLETPSASLPKDDDGPAGLRADPPGPTHQSPACAVGLLSWAQLTFASISAKSRPSCPEIWLPGICDPCACFAGGHLLAAAFAVELVCAEAAAGAEA